MTGAALGVIFAGLLLHSTLFLLPQSIALTQRLSNGKIDDSFFLATTNTAKDPKNNTKLQASQAPPQLTANRAITLAQWNAADGAPSPSATITRKVHIDILCYENRIDLPLVNVTIGAWANYARGQGYGYTHMSKHVLDSDAHPKFNKYAYILELFDKQIIAGEQWVLWVDSDIFIAHTDFNFESIIERFGHSETEMILSRDYRNTAIPVNNGIFLIRNSEWSRKFLERMVKEGPRILAAAQKKKSKQYGFNWKLVDQPTFTWLLIDDMKAIQIRDSRVDTVINKRVSITPTRTFNSFCRPLPFYKTSDGKRHHIWRREDPIMHITGLNITRRLLVLERVQATIKGVPHKGTNVTMDPRYNPCIDYTFLK